ncbi:hypothetical protein [Nocardioides piscis]|uniref:Glycosyltransferase RgtA/B/C/D-like domain-containing protein n=1 Tax=Nocardioides piscis TaxID=2714938 RepID=A0A6G7YFP2_9ACTN|nr:hypothetical protein [Nocardioides piscis]QIK75458.1 hypothetical protein G7071_08410 [Nocardioides piscis]
MPRLRLSVPRVVVGLAMVAVVLARFPSAMWPLRPDEAGFLLVARAWDPRPDSLYGPYFVDRAPEIIALVGLTDRIGGAYALRVVAALGLGAFVLLAALTARRLAVQAGSTRVGAAAAWTAVAAAALVSHAEIDPVSAKGEHLGIPLVMAACWLSLAALQERSVRRAVAAGVVAVLAVGMKQSLVGGLVFGGVLLVGSTLVGPARVPARSAIRLAAAATLGASLPVVATVGWALVAGVDLATLWHAVVGFRGDAAAVIAAQPNDALDVRAEEMRDVVRGSGMAALAVWFVVALPWLLRRCAAPALAVAALLAVDAAGVVLSGSFWMPYLLALAPGLTLAVGLLVTALPERLPSLATWALIAFLVVRSAESLMWWFDTYADATPQEVAAGRAIAAAADPEDTLVVYGGRPDIQWASGLPSPYPHLWSLPMRTLDPRLDELQRVLTGPQAPAWFVQFQRLDTWSETGTAEIREELLTDYELVAIACESYRVYLRRGLDRPAVSADCD